MIINMFNTNREVFLIFVFICINISDDLYTIWINMKCLHSIEYEHEFQR